MSAPRHTARGIVIHDGRLLLIERFRGRMHYYSIPGGGIEAGETPEQTVIREIMEETSCTVRLKRPLYVMRHGQNLHHIFLCEYESGEPMLRPDSPEALRHDPNNRFIPKWVPLESLSRASFMVWRPIQRQLLRDLKRGFSDDTRLIVADAAR